MLEPTILMCGGAWCHQRRLPLITSVMNLGRKRLFISTIRTPVSVDEAFCLQREAFAVGANVVIYYILIEQDRCDYSLSSVKFGSLPGGGAPLRWISPAFLRSSTGLNVGSGALSTLSEPPGKRRW